MCNLLFILFIKWVIFWTISLSVSCAPSRPRASTVVATSLLDLLVFRSCSLKASFETFYRAKARACCWGWTVEAGFWFLHLGVDNIPRNDPNWGEIRCSENTAMLDLTGIAFATHEEVASQYRLQTDSSKQPILFACIRQLSHCSARAGVVLDVVLNGCYTFHCV